jgi:hypothetical protein
MDSRSGDNISVEYYDMIRNQLAVYQKVGEMAKPFSQPISEKLLPDWPYIPNTPPGVPCPPTLVSSQLFRLK